MRVAWQGWYVLRWTIRTACLACLGPVPLSNFVVNARMPDCQASDQSDTWMKKNTDAGTSPVPEYGDPLRYRNAPVSEGRCWQHWHWCLDANAHLCWSMLLNIVWNWREGQQGRCCIHNIGRKSCNFWEFCKRKEEFEILPLNKMARRSRTFSEPTAFSTQLYKPLQSSTACKTKTLGYRCLLCGLYSKSVL